MGRPREHDEDTAVRLLEAAEQIVAEEGLESVSVRRVAVAGGTTTRAVYSVFGSKDGLVVALGVRAFDMLRLAIDALPASTHPAQDLVDAGVNVFRRFALDHPALFRLAVQHMDVSPELAEGFSRAAQQALGGLESRVDRLLTTARAGERTVSDAVCEFHALCEGLAALELRGAMGGTEQHERVWRDGLGSLVAGWGVVQGPRATAQVD